MIGDNAWVAIIRTRRGRGILLLAALPMAVGQWGGDRKDRHCDRRYEYYDRLYEHYTSFIMLVRALYEPYTSIYPLVWDTLSSK